jgi:rhodanese-related sulfurtransferase
METGDPQMKKLLLTVILLFLVWDAAWWLLGVKPLFPWQLNRQLRSGQSDLFLLDVRTPMEFAWFHLPEALNLPDALDKGKMAQLPKERHLVVICLTGHRSPLVAYALKRQGFKGVYNLTWGMLGWKIYKLFSPLFGAGSST